MQEYGESVHPALSPSSGLRSTAIEAAVAEIDDDHGEPDGRFRRRDGKHQQREHLPHEVVQVDRERDD